MRKVELCMLLLLLYCGFGVSVNLRANYEGYKDGPCSGDAIVLTCSLVGFSLRWTVIDTSLSLLSSNTITLSADENNVGTMFDIPTSTIDLKFYQTRTTQNFTHPSSSTIESQMHFHLLENEFIEVSCTSSTLETRSRSIRTLGTPATPTNLHTTDHVVVGTSNCSHEVEWSMTETMGVEEFLLMSFVNGTPDVTRHIHHKENLAIYFKGLEDNVTLKIVAVSQCNIESNMSNPLNLPPMAPPPDMECASMAPPSDIECEGDSMFLIPVSVALAVCLVICIIITIVCYCCTGKREAKVHCDKIYDDGGAESTIPMQVSEDISTAQVVVTVEAKTTPDHNEDVVVISGYNTSSTTATAVFQSKDTSQVLQEITAKKIGFVRKE